MFVCASASQQAHSQNLDCNNGCSTYAQYALAQRLHLPSIRVDAESAVSHAEGAILAGKFLQTIAHVHVSARRAVLGAQDDALTGVAGGILAR